MTSTLMLVTVLIFVFGSVAATVLFFLQIFRKRAVRKEDARSWRDTLDTLFWGLL